MRRLLQYRLPRWRRMYHFQSPPPRILRQFCTAEDDGGPSKSSISGRAEMATTPPPPDTSSVAPGFDVTSFLALDEIQREKRISETQRALRAAYKQGDHSSALEGAKLLRDQCALHFTRNHPAYASALNDLGLMHKELGEHAFAVEAYLEALRVYRAAFGMENHPSFATTLANCGLAFRAYAAGCPALERMGLLDRAKEHLERAVELRREVLGKGHPELELSISHLAGVHADLGKKAEAEEGMTRSMERLQKSVGEVHPATATATNNLALFLKRNGRYSEALPLYRSALNARAELYGSSHPTTIAARNNLAECLHEMGDEAGATEQRRAILASLGHG